MSAELPASARIEIVGPSDGAHDARLWGDVPRDRWLDWLRVASRSWPFFPGATVGGLTAQALHAGRLVRSEALIRVARNAFEAGFTPEEYALFRDLVRGRIPEDVVVTRDHRPAFADRFVEVDAARCRVWLDRVRAGQSPEEAVEGFLQDVVRKRRNPRRIGGSSGGDGGI